MAMGKEGVVVVAVVDVGVVVVATEARTRKPRFTPKKNRKSYHTRKGIEFEKSVTERVNRAAPSVIFRKCPRSN